MAHAQHLLPPTNTSPFEKEHHKKILKRSLNIELV